MKRFYTFVRQNFQTSYVGGLVAFVFLCAVAQFTGHAQRFRTYNFGAQYLQFQNMPTTNTGAANASVSGQINEWLTYTTDKGSASNNFCYWPDNGEWRMYSNRQNGDGNSITFFAQNGVTIKDISMHYKQPVNASDSLTYFVNNAPGQKIVKDSAGNFVLNNIYADSVKFKNMHKGGTKNLQVWIDAIRFTLSLYDSAFIVEICPGYTYTYNGQEYEVWDIVKIDTIRSTQVDTIVYTEVWHYEDPSTCEYPITVTPPTNGTITCDLSTIYYNNSPVYTITAAPCYEIETILVDDAEIAITDNHEMTYTFTNVNNLGHTIAATFKAIEYDVNVTFAGVIRPAHNETITCGENFTYDLPNIDGYSFVSVLNGEDEVEVTQEDGVYSFSVAQVQSNMNFVANYRINKFGITATATGNGTIEGPDTVSYGEDATYTFTADACHRLSSLMLDGEDVTADVTGNLEAASQYTIANVQAAHNLVATFVQSEYDVTVTYAGTGSGTATPATAHVVCGEDMGTLEVVANADSYVDSYTITRNGTPQTFDIASSNFTHFSFPINNVTSDVAVVITFNRYVKNVTAVAATANGTLCCDTEVLQGDACTLVARAAEGYHVDYITNGVDTIRYQREDSVVNYTIESVTTDMTIKAAFAINKYRIVTAGEDATASVVDVTVDHGTNLDITFTAEECYNFVALADSGSNGYMWVDRTVIAGTTTHTYTLSNISCDHYVTVEAAPMPKTITATANFTDATPAATLPTATVLCHEAYDYTITAPLGYHVSKVEVGATEVYKDTTAAQQTSYTHHFGDVTADVTIVATFAPSVFNVTANVTEGDATIVGAPTAAVGYNTPITLTITPADCNKVSSLLVNGNEVLADATVAADQVVTYTFDVTEHTAIEVNTEVISYNLSWKVGGIVNGSIRVEDENDALISNDTIQGTLARSCGESVNFVIRAKEGYHIAAIVRNGVAATYNENAYNNEVVAIATLNQNEDIEVRFALNRYTINFNITGTNTVPSQTIHANHGTEVSHTLAVADEYHHIVSVTTGASVVNLGGNNDKEYVWTVANLVSDLDVDVVMALDTLTATITAGANGKIVRNNADAVYTTAEDAQADWNNKPYVLTDEAAGQYVGEGTFEITYLANPYINLEFEVVANHCYELAGVSYQNNTTNEVAEGLTVNTFNFNAAEAFSATATFARLERAVTASVEAGLGSVTPATSTILCGEGINLIIAPEVGYHVDAITINGVAYDITNLEEGAHNTFTLALTNVDVDTEVKVSFAINIYTITAEFTDNQGVFTPATTNVAHGTEVDLAITLLSTCDHVATLTLNGEAATIGELLSGAVYTFTVTEDTRIEATTAINIYNANADITGEGTVTEAEVECNEAYTYVMTAAEGWHIESYTLNGVTTNLGANDDNTASVTVGNMLSDTTLTVVFERDIFTLTTRVMQGSGTWNVETIDLRYGETYDFVATADAANGWYLARIQCADAVVDYPMNTLVGTFTVNPVVSDTLIYAFFMVQEHQLTASVVGNGTITPAGELVVVDRESVEYTIVPNDCHYISQILVDGQAIEITDSLQMTYSFDRITEDHTIEAQFVNYTYNMTSVAGANGTVSSAVVDCGTDYTYTIAADYGYHIDRVIVDGQDPIVFQNQEAQHTVAFTNVREDHHVEAFFALNSYTVTATAGQNGTIMLQGTQTVNHGGSATYTIHAEGCYHIDAITVNGNEVVTFNNNENLYDYTLTNIESDCAVHATFAINTYNVTATAGANGTIAPAGTATYNCGDDVTYTITPAEGYAIADVLINGTSAGAIPTVTLTAINNDFTIEAQFVAIVHEITATANGYGQVVASAQTVADGADVEFTFTPEACYTLTEVLVNGVSYLNQVANNTLEINNVQEDINLVATYQREQFTVTATAGVGGTITESNVFYCGSDVVYEINVDPCYEIASVEVDGMAQAIATSYTFAAIDANHTINVTFTMKSYDVVANVNNAAWGTITPAGTSTYNCGESVDYVITPAEGAYIVSVEVDGVNVGVVNAWRIAQIDANHTINVTFAQETYTVTAYSNGHATVLPNLGETTVTYGDNLTYNFAAANCYRIADVIVNGVSQGAIATYTFSNITEDQTIQVVTEAIQYTITASVDSEVAGTISPVGATQVVCGGSQAYTITPAEGYVISDVLVNGTSVGAVSLYTFENVTANATIQARFTAIAAAQYTITATARDNGTITPAGTTTVSRGQSVAYTIVAEEFYTIADVLVDGVSVGAVNYYVFTDVVANHTIEASFEPASCDVPTYVYTSDITGNSATLNWSDMGATSYTIRYKKLTDVNFTEVTGITTNTYVLNGLSAMTDYVWSVKSVCLAGISESAWSSQVNFATLITGINDFDAASLKVYSYGNNIYVANEGQEVINSVQVFDMFGRVVYTGKAQNNPEVIALQSATGNYIVKVVTNKKVRTYKVNISQR